MNDRRYPWLILIPRQAGLAEIIDLSPPDRQTLMIELSLVSKVLKEHVPCDKLNIGALGNLVPQLHIHVLARRQGDAAWPGPVWGHGAAEPYDPKTALKLPAQLAKAIKDEYIEQSP